MLCLGDDNEMFSSYCSGNGDTVYRLLSGWLGKAETVFMLFFIVLWQGLFIWLFSQIRKKRNVSDEFKFSKGVWYITMPVSSLLSPLLSLMVFIIGTLYELRRVSGCISIKNGGKINSKTNMMGVKS